MRAQQLESAVDAAAVDQRDHADAHVERALEVVLLDPAERAHQWEDRLRRPGAAVHVCDEMHGQHPAQVGREAATGDVRHGMRLAGARQRQARFGVEPGGLDQLGSQRAPELGDVAVQSPAGRLEQHVPHQ